MLILDTMKIYSRIKIRILYFINNNLIRHSIEQTDFSSGKQIPYKPKKHYFFVELLFYKICFESK